MYHILALTLIFSANILVAQDAKLSCGQAAVYSTLKYFKSAIDENTKKALFSTQLDNFEQIINYLSTHQIIGNAYKADIDDIKTSDCPIIAQLVFSDNGVNTAHFTTIFKIDPHKGIGLIDITLKSDGILWMKHSRFAEVFSGYIIKAGK